MNNLFSENAAVHGERQKLNEAWHRRELKRVSRSVEADVWEASLAGTESPQHPTIQTCGGFLHFLRIFSASLWRGSCFQGVIPAPPPHLTSVHFTLSPLSSWPLSLQLSSLLPLVPLPCARHCLHPFIIAISHHQCHFCHHQFTVIVIIDSSSQ